MIKQSLWIVKICKINHLEYLMDLLTQLVVEKVCGIHFTPYYFINSVCNARLGFLFTACASLQAFDLGTRFTHTFRIQAYTTLIGKPMNRPNGKDK